MQHLWCVPTCKTVLSLLYRTPLIHSNQRNNTRLHVWTSNIILLKTKYIINSSIKPTHVFHQNTLILCVVHTTNCKACRYTRAKLLNYGTNRAYQNDNNGVHIFHFFHSFYIEVLTPFYPSIMNPFKLWSLEFLSIGYIEYGIFECLDFCTIWEESCTLVAVQKSNFFK